MPATQSSQKWLPVAITENQTQAGQTAQSAFAHQRPAHGEHDHAHDQRVAGVEARHRRVRVGRQLHEAVPVLVDEADAEQPRRRRRHDDVPEQADHVREQDRVAEADERVVPPEVDPEHGEPDDRELGVPVRPGDRRLEQVALVDELLERELVQAVRDARLEVEHAVAVRERLVRVAVRERTRELVEHREPEPDPELEAEIAPPARQVPAACCHHRGHDSSKCNSRGG